MIVAYPLILNIVNTLGILLKVLELAYRIKATGLINRYDTRLKVIHLCHIYVNQTASIQMKLGNKEIKHSRNFIT